MERVDTRYAMHKLTALEADAALNAMQHSPHARLRVLPNHHMNTEGELQGFHFTCNRDDLAHVLPMSRRMFSMTSVYECLDGSQGQPLNGHVVRIVQDMPKYQETLDNYIRGLDASELPFAGFASIPEATPAPRAEEGLVFSPAAVDQIAWGCSVPAKAGLYHAFTRTNANATREHKVYIIVSGCLTHAAEEWYNLWLDSGKHATCGELLECEELEWLRTATHRSHNRIAADLSSLFGVRLRIVLDTKNPVPNTLMAMPTTTTYMNDIRVAAVSHEIMLSESACFTDASDNGIIVDMFSAEGFWLFQGPCDHANFNLHGTIFGSEIDNCSFPTKITRYHSKYRGVASSTVAVQAEKVKHNIVFRDDSESREGGTFLFPDEQFMRVVEQLGFNRNDGIISLMPLICYVHDE